MHSFAVISIVDIPLLSGKTLQNGIQSIYCDQENNGGSWKGKEIRYKLETSNRYILMGITSTLYSECSSEAGGITVIGKSVANR